MNGDKVAQMRIWGGGGVCVCEVTASARASAGCTHLRVEDDSLMGRGAPHRGRRVLVGRGKKQESRELKPFFITMGECRQEISEKELEGRVTRTN